MYYVSILRHFLTQLAGLRRSFQTGSKVKFFFRLELEQTKQFSNSLLEPDTKTDKRDES
jgi:hypothetical protein